MKILIQMGLERAARKAGADRYQGKVNEEEFMIYLPQSITRKGGGPPVHELTITIETKPIP